MIALKTLENIKIESHEMIFYLVYDGAIHACFVRGRYELGAEAISQKQPCMTSYFKSGVESRRAARPGQGSGWGLSLVPQTPRSTEAHSISSWPEPGHWFIGQGDYDQTSHEDHPDSCTGRQQHKNTHARRQKMT